MAYWRKWNRVCAGYYRYKNYEIHFWEDHDVETDKRFPFWELIEVITDDGEFEQMGCYRTYKQAKHSLDIILDREGTDPPTEK